MDPRGDRSPGELLPPAVLVDRRSDGAILVRSPVALEPHPETLSERLAHWAERAPDRVFLGERAGEGWRTITYAAAHVEVQALAQGLAERGLGPQRPLVILSDNSVDVGLLLLAAMHVGVPVAMVRAIGALVRPALAFADDGERYGRALAVLVRDGAEALIGGAGLRELRRPPGAAVADLHAVTGPDSVAKILFTSGSTGAPKGVINTQRMLCANQQAIAQLWPFLRARPPVLVDWLPWNHTFGGNHNFNMVLFHGGTLMIDDGKPAPGLIERTARNLREVSPTLYFNVPRGFDVLLPFLEADRGLCERFFAELDLIFYAAAALPQSLWERLERLSLRTLGRKIFMSSAWGATETAPLCTSVHYPIDHAGVIGLPAPGCVLKLAPTAGRREIRVKAPWVTPGYLGHPELSAAAFDDEGFYRTGDAGDFVDPEDPARGLSFAGRIAEDFKLSSGTWVSVGALRVAVIAATSPLIQDAVIAGEGRGALGLLLFANLAACRDHLGAAAAGLADDDVLEHPRVREHLLAGLREHNARGPQSSRRIAAALVMREAPQIDAGEITDKGYLNQRAVLARRAELVTRLDAAAATEAVDGGADAGEVALLRLDA